MEPKQLADRGLALIKKYKYLLVVLIAGIILMLLPSGNKTKTVSTQTVQESVFDDPTQELQTILAQIKGAGKVRLMLTLSAGEKAIYQSNSDTNQSNDTSSVRVETVIITDTDRSQQPVIQQYIAPKYRGAVVVCQGADDPNVKLAIMDAVKNMTGLGYDRISVLKMK